MTTREDQLDPTPSQVLEQMMESVGLDIRVAIPAIVTKVESTDPPTVTAAPAVRRQGSKADPPVPGVRVAVMRSGGATVALPVSVGDPVWLMIADRDIDGWQAADGDKQVEAQDPRTHDLADCVAYPMDIGSLPSGAAGALWIGYAGNYIKQVSGTHTLEGTSIKIGSGATEPMVLGTTLNAHLLTVLGALSTYLGLVGAAMQELGGDAALAGATKTKCLAAGATPAGTAATAVTTFTTPPVSTARLATKGKVQ